MLFNSLPFVIFFSLFFLLYWKVFYTSHRWQNLLILAGSYFFYGWWDLRFLFLLAGSSLINFILGMQLQRAHEERTRRVLLGLGLFQGLGSLFFFKYFNFFIESLVSAFASFHISLDIHTLHVLLPLGISFYTFRTISYLLDIKKNRFTPTRDWVVFFSYVSFFPCLLSGPIDRPATLIPQLEKKRLFSYQQASDGMRQILWGLFKKMVIADNCAGFTATIFDHYRTWPASSLLFGAFLYTIQIYADFSGYSDMAIGLSNLLGFTITRNFNFPFFAQNIADFWRKWHISLTTWLTDYVFVPLTIYFRDYGKAGVILAILINFTAIGIWHGPNWTFVLFGFLHGCYYIPLILRGTMNKRTKIPAHRVVPPVRALVNMAATFLLVMFTFVIFRSDNLSQAFVYYHRLFSPSLFSGLIITEKVNTIATLICIVIMFLVEWLQRDKQHGLEIDFIQRFTFRALIYGGLLLIILTFSATKNADFIYFRF